MPPLRVNCASVQFYRRRIFRLRLFNTFVRGINSSSSSWRHGLTFDFYLRRNPTLAAPVSARIALGLVFDFKALAAPVSARILTEGLTLPACATPPAMLARKTPVVMMTAALIIILDMYPTP